MTKSDANFLLILAAIGLFLLFLILRVLLEIAQALKRFTVPDPDDSTKLHLNDMKLERIANSLERQEGIDIDAVERQEQSSATP